ncbi:spore germination protein [Bacillus methanolicus]|uniref:spore germination protein n=1 Tax=Bacillus methanolicus TaxID=1471 RepID=UPI00200D6C48|nr:spore germination protein [Bacillus methanolicus]UQD51011.1 spore germination protein [Bacillus methanolicus]
MKKWFKNNRNKEEFEKKDGQKVLLKSYDYKKTFYYNQKNNIRFSLTFISTLIDQNVLHQTVLPHLQENEFTTLDDIKKIIPISDMEISDDPSIIEQKLFNGYVMLTIEPDEKRFAFIAAQKLIVRSITAPEVEFSVIGPKEAFVESIDQNLNLIRKRVPVKELVIESLSVGNISKTKIAILHIDGITDPENVNTVRQRIQEIEYDQITDSSYIVQLIADNVHSPFPQMLDTERPDRIAAILAEGKVAVVVDGSPHVLIAPTTIVEFFNAFEDYNLLWHSASFFRMLRLFSVGFSILVTPIYVAALTYHYELIPKDLLTTLITSRRVVPLPPILEALLLELVIELLREAGARLPTKVGQTIGIVGGIVIGTASVEAGLTSNILLIMVALSALASFTTPVYKMGNSIRLMRFPFMLFAHLWGLVGIVFCFCFLLTHAIRLTSLGRPFLEPLYPPRLADLKDALIRLPFDKQRMRPEYLRTEQPVRFGKKKANVVKKDIDE